LICVPENGQATRVLILDLSVEEGDARRDAKAGDGLRLYNRSVHVFLTNPFGGRPDIVRHLHEKISNVDELVNFY
jgi:hypothetical protein